MRVFWQEQVRRSAYMGAFKAAATALIVAESKGFGGTLVVLCINGGMISSVDAGEMQNIVKDAQKLGAESGIAVRVQLRAMNYCDFLAEYDTPPPPVRPGNFILAARELNLGAMHALLSAGADPHALTRGGVYV